MSAQIKALRKQEAILVQKLKDLATSTDREETKKAQSDLLTARMQVIELQVAGLGRQQAKGGSQGGEAIASATNTAKSAARPPAVQPRSLDGAGIRVDLKA